MKIIKYQTLNRYNVGTDEASDWREGVGECIIGYNEANLELAKQEAYNGKFTIEELEIVYEPTQLDRVESQVAYLAMMTGYTDILEV